ncbi:MAG: class I SAM-dependent methyltransferase [Proteobacteria bacterium]|nr:class I SAM-dependent methyltransferase [Pseudomonadota bacterium]MBU1610736.1 class I SAM-dependent methyltransferase [Pseudomonadota bacterium]
MKHPELETLRQTTTDEDQRVYWEQEHGFRRSDHPIVRYFASQRWQMIKRHLDASEVHTALDLGCGDGFSTLYAPDDWEIVCCDASLHMLRGNTHSKKALADACALPFADNTFDLVYTWELLHHVETPRTAMIEMRRVSKRFVLIFEPNPYNPAQLAFSYVDKEHSWVRRNTFSHLPGLAKQAGLRIVWSTIGGLIFPNKTPQWLFPLLRLLPFRLPLFGISQVLLLEKT